MKVPIVVSLATYLYGLFRSGLLNVQSEMVTSAKPTNKFFDRSLAVLSTNVLFLITALALLREIVFLMAEFCSKLHPSILLTSVDEAPKTSIVEDTFA